MVEERGGDVSAEEGEEEGATEEEEVPYLEGSAGLGE